MSEPAVPSLMRVAVTSNLGKESQISFEFTVPVIAEAGMLNGILDRAREAAIRQQSKYELEATEFQLGHDQRLYEQLATDLAAVELREDKVRTAFYADRRPNDRREWKRGEREEQHRSQVVEQLSRMKLQIATVQARIEDLKKKAA